MLLRRVYVARILVRASGVAGLEQHRQHHVGVVHSSNLCTEITLNTSDDEIAVCNLGSVNLPQHVTADGLDHGKLKKTITTAMRRSEEHTSELQSRPHLVCRLLLEKKKKK